MLQMYSMIPEPLRNANTEPLTASEVRQAVEELRRLDAEGDPFGPFRKIPPGLTIYREIRARGWSEQEFATMIGLSNSQAQKILSGEGKITPKIAGKLADVFGISRDIWLKLEFNYRSWTAGGESATET